MSTDAPAFSTCPIEGCGRRSRSRDGGLCAGHAKQKQLGKPFTALRPRGRSKREVYIDAMFHFFDLDSMEADAKARHRAWMRLHMAGRRLFGVSKGDD